jgi:hypothetical protein
MISEVHFKQVSQLQVVPIAIESEFLLSQILFCAKLSNQVIKLLNLNQHIG